MHAQPGAATVELPSTAASVRAARRFVVAQLVLWGLDSLSETAALLTSELVTNSVLHAGTPVTVEVRREGDCVSVAVTDGSVHVPRMRRHTATATTGRGLALLERLADRWEVVPRGSGKTVSFVLADSADPWAGFTGADWDTAEL